MNFKLGLSFVLILLFSCSTFSKTNPKLKTKSNSPAKIKILSFFAVKKLSSRAKKDYVQALAKTLIKLNQEPKDKYSINIFNLISREFTKANASTKYLCIGGGVPVHSDSPVCGVNSYAGFTCPAGLEICNPLIFGVDKDQKPVCHVTASTSWCFQNTKLGVDHFLEPVFALNNEKKWNELLTFLEESCNNPNSISEDQNLVRSACDNVRRQMVYNEEVKKILTDGYSYQTVDGYGIRPAPTAENEALGAEALRAIESTREEASE